MNPIPSQNCDGVLNKSGCFELKIADLLTGFWPSADGHLPSDEPVGQFLIKCLNIMTLYSWLLLRKGFFPICKFSSFSQFIRPGFGTLRLLSDPGFGTLHLSQACGFRNERCDYTLMIIVGILALIALLGVGAGFVFFRVLENRALSKTSWRIFRGNQL